MRISTVSRTTVTALFLTVGCLVVSIFWALGDLEQAFKSRQSFESLQQNVSDRVISPVESYLSLGDSTLLDSAEQELSLYREEIELSDLLTGDEKNELLVLLNRLNEDLTLKLRAAGKLNNPFVILSLSEAEMLHSFETLYELSTRTLDRSLGQRYQIKAVEGLALIAEIRERRSRFQVNSSEAEKGLAETVEHLTELIGSIDVLPRLKVYAEEEKSSDDGIGALMGWAEESTAVKDDLSDAPISELKTQIGRYPKELTNVQILMEQKLQAEDDVSATILAIQKGFIVGKHRLSELYDLVQTRVYWVVVVAVIIILATGGLLSVLTFSLARLVTKSSTIALALARGELKTEPEVNSIFFEGIHLEEALKDMRLYLIKLISDIQKEASRLNDLQSASLSSADKLTRIVEQQRQSTISTADQISQLSTSFGEVATNAVTTTNSTSQAKANIEVGIAALNKTCDQLKLLSDEALSSEITLVDLQKDVKEIESTLSVIRDFADQTNLLALNAAIEAARAGDSGRGFAVVASEVRQLAVNTAASANQIQSLVERLTRNTERTVSQMKKQNREANLTLAEAAETQTSISAMDESIGQIHEQSLLIASATEQQSTVAKSLLGAINETAELSGQSEHEAIQNTQYAHALGEINQQLTRLVAHLKLQ